MEKIIFTVTDIDANQRIDKYLKKQLSEAPVSFIYRLFRLKDVRVNNKRVALDYILNVNDEITIFLTAEQQSEFIKDYSFERVSLTSPILYEDENVLVVNKNRGVLVHPDINEQVNTLNNQVLTYLFEKCEFDPKSRSYIPSPINRIDKQTSGVLIFAKKQEINQLLSKALHDNLVVREYVALVHGDMNGEGEIVSSLLKEERCGLVKVDEDGKKSTTRFEVIKRYGSYTLLKVLLETGRSNQIRVHLQSIGHPIVGDHKYGREDEFNTLCLHHKRIKFYNVTGIGAYLNAKDLVAPLPVDFEKTLKRIEE